MTTDDGPAADGELDVSAAELIERVMRVAHLIRRTSMASLAPLDLTPAQSRALRTISRADTPIRMGELASTLGVVPRSATGLVDALQEAGLVERGADPGNRRSVLVTLTEAGRRMQREMAAARTSAAAPPGSRIAQSSHDRACPSRITQWAMRISAGKARAFAASQSPAATLMPKRGTSTASAARYNTQSTELIRSAMDVIP